MYFSFIARHQPQHKTPCASYVPHHQLWARLCISGENEFAELFNNQTKWYAQLCMQFLFQIVASLAKVFNLVPCWVCRHWWELSGITVFFRAPQDLWQGWCPEDTCILYFVVLCHFLSRTQLSSFSRSVTCSFKSLSAEVAADLEGGGIFKGSSLKSECYK